MREWWETPLYILIGIVITLAIIFAIIALGLITYEMIIHANDPTFWKSS